MSKSLTIKNIKTIMETIKGEHPQINTILKGNVWDVDLTKDVSGVYLIYEIVNIAPNGFNGIDYSVDLFICDNVSDINTETNEVSVQNECSLIGLDIMSILRNYDKGGNDEKDIALTLGSSWSIQPFAERFDSLYAGAAINMTLSSAYGYSRCLTPLIPSDLTLDQLVKVYVNGALDQSFTINAYDDNTINITP